jgi:membrane protein DedA with SNARE-associated domain
MFDLAQIMVWISAYKYIAVFVLAVLEGPIITVIAGFFASLGQMSLAVAFALIVIGDLVGDFLHYAAGRWGREAFVERWGRYVGITTERVIKMEGYFSVHPLKTYAFAKFAHGIGGVALVAAGLVREPLWEFFWYNLLFTVPKSALLLALGYFFGASLASIEAYLGLAGQIIVALCIVGVIIYVFYYRTPPKDETLPL